MGRPGPIAKPGCARSRSARLRDSGAPAITELPPPDGVEALYHEGMAAYQHRHWEEALDRFTRLKELQPSRPGLDALLDEVRWFLQLQAAAPPGGPSSGAVQGKAGIAGWRPRSWSARGRALLVIALGILALVALLLVAFGGRLPWQENRAAEELYTRGQARLAVGDYEGAQADFVKLLEVAPGDQEALAGLERAKSQQTLAQGYAAAELAIGDEDWERASAELGAILAADPTYKDARGKSDYVNQQRRLAGLYADGGRLYDLGQWTEALAQFRKIRDIDAAYRAAMVGEFLFVCYLNVGEDLHATEGGSLDDVKAAVDYFEEALAVHPRNRPRHRSAAAGRDVPGRAAGPRAGRPGAGTKPVVGIGRRSAGVCGRTGCAAAVRPDRRCGPRCPGRRGYPRPRSSASDRHRRCR